MSHLLVVPIRHCDNYDGDAAAELWRCLHVCMCVLFVSVHHDVTVV